MSDPRRIAYFSMEIGLEPSMPTYTGGLGILAGDTVRAAADLKVPMVAVTLLHRKGYFYQRLDANGWQTEEPVDWVVDGLPPGEPGCGSASCRGPSRLAAGLALRRAGRQRLPCPVYLLDTDLPENAGGPATDRHALRRRPALPALPGGDPGIGGVACCAPWATRHPTVPHERGPRRRC